MTNELIYLTRSRVNMCELIEIMAHIELNKKDARELLKTAYYATDSLACMSKEEAYSNLVELIGLLTKYAGKLRKESGVEGEKIANYINLIGFEITL